MGGSLVAATVAVATVLALALRAPSNDRTWAPDHARLPTIALTLDSVHISGVRDFHRRPDGTVIEGYADRRWSLDQAESVWFAIAPFADRFRGLAHTFVSFGFDDGRYLAVSVEARREEGERYSLLGGLMRGFEVIHVLGAERDVVGLRALRGDHLLLYPSVATPEQARALLATLLERAMATQDRPEFYNTILNNCTTNLVEPVNRATPAELPWGWGILLPGLSDGLALREGLLRVDDGEPGIEALRSRHRVDGAAREALTLDDAAFSEAIRAPRQLR